MKNGTGPALKLIVRDGQPPLAVNSSGKVANLNSDQLDGESEVDFYAAGSKVADSSHADTADSATSAQNATRARTTRLTPTSSTTSTRPTSSVPMPKRAATWTRPTQTPLLPTARSPRRSSPIGP